MFQLHEVIKFGRFFGRQASGFFLVQQIRDVVFGLLLGLETRNGIRGSAGGNEFNDFVVCSNHPLIVSLSMRCAKGKRSRPSFVIPGRVTFPVNLKKASHRSTMSTNDGRDHFTPETPERR